MFKIIVPESGEQKAPTWVDVWYDRGVQSWVIQVKTEDGEQFEDSAIYVYSKTEALQISDMKHREYNLDSKYSKKKQKEYREKLKDM